MEVVNRELQHLILELQSFDLLSSFALAGGTSLAMRFNHRNSVDIDLFTQKMIGRSGFDMIQDRFRRFYKSSLKFCELINIESGGQYCFLRSLINKEGKDIKVELIQNIQILDPVEIYNGVRILSLKDIGLLKLVSACSRKAKKDIYDLDLITDEIQLKKLIEFSIQKAEVYNKSEHKSLFDLDGDITPINDVSLLLEFDNIDYTSLPLRPSHSTDRIDILPSG